MKPIFTTVKEALLHKRKLAEIRRRIRSGHYSRPEVLRELASLLGKRLNP